MNLGITLSDWIKNTKEKLKEREHRLILKRNNLTAYIVNENLHNFYQEHNLWIEPHKFIINDNLISNVLNMLFIKINEWNGFDLRRTKKTYTLFSDYYAHAKGWWDGSPNKQVIYGTNYWQHLFKLIYNHIKTYSNVHYQGNKIFNSSQYIYIKCLFVKIIQNLFKEKIQLESTRALPLISICIIKRCNQIQNYLYFNVDKSLDISKWIQEESQKLKTKKINYVKATILSTKLNSTFVMLSKQLHNEFTYHINVKYYELIKIIFDYNTIENSNNNAGSSNFSNDHNHYCAIHGVSNVVSTYRYSPLR